MSPSLFLFFSPAFPSSLSRPASQLDSHLQPLLEPSCTMAKTATVGDVELSRSDETIVVEGNHVSLDELPDYRRRSRSSFGIFADTLQLPQYL